MALTTVRSGRLCDEVDEVDEVVEQLAAAIAAGDPDAARSAADRYPRAARAIVEPDR